MPSFPTPVFSSCLSFFPFHSPPSFPVTTRVRPVGRHDWYKKINYAQIATLQANLVMLAHADEMSTLMAAEGIKPPELRTLKERAMAIVCITGQALRDFVEGYLAFYNKALETANATSGGGEAKVR